MAVKQLSDGNSAGATLGQSASDLVGFHGATPTAQRAGAAQAALTGTTVSATAGRGFKTSAAFNATIALISEMRAALVEKGIIKGAS
jgi:hypothetical protein